MNSLTSDKSTDSSLLRGTLWLCNAWKKHIMYIITDFLSGRLVFTSKKKKKEKKSIYPPVFECIKKYIIVNTFLAFFKTFTAKKLN